MLVALIGPELEENLGLRYMASSLESRGHEAEIIEFNSARDAPRAIDQVISINPEIAGLSMVFTIRGREFCSLAEALRDNKYLGHIIAGGPFASFNSEQLLHDFLAIDSIALGEGENLICNLADNLSDLSKVPGLCHRKSDGTVVINAMQYNLHDLDSLPFPKRSKLKTHFDKPLTNMLTSRGCWRNCAFCSINAWYERVGSKNFRARSIKNVVEEMKELYFRHGARIFNFQDDNFYMPNKQEALNRFYELRDRLADRGIINIAIAIKARPDSITYESVKVLDELNLFRVFLGVENASENGLRNLNRHQTMEQTLSALKILNDFDIHVAYNLLLFEPDTVMADILTNLSFIERYIDNPFNFCRTEVHPGTGLEKKLRAEKGLLGNYFEPDYKIKDPQVETFYKIANHAFFDRNFNDMGLNYFCMGVDYYFQLLRRFHPEVLSQSLRALTRSYVKQVNLDTYQRLCQIYDFVEQIGPEDTEAILSFAREMREGVDEASRELYGEGERIQAWLQSAYDHRNEAKKCAPPSMNKSCLDISSAPIPYDVFKRLLEENGIVEQ